MVQSFLNVDSTMELYPDTSDAIVSHKRKPLLFGFTKEALEPQVFDTSDIVTQYAQRCNYFSSNKNFYDNANAELESNCGATAPPMKSGRTLGNHVTVALSDDESRSMFVGTDYDGVLDVDPTEIVTTMNSRCTAAQMNSSKSRLKTKEQACSDEHGRRTMTKNFGMSEQCYGGNHNGQPASLPLKTRMMDAAYYQNSTLRGNGA